jgi:seryl-tRNA synthetase
VYHYRLELAEPVIAEHLDELRRRVYFVSESIVDFELAGGPDGVLAVDVTTERPADPAELTRKLRFVVANDVAPQLRTPPKVLWRSGTERRARPHTFESLLADGVVHQVGPGQVALGQPALAALDALDSLVRDIVVGEFGAVEYRYPTLLPIRALHRSGYLSSFPQHLMFAARLHGDVDTYREFVQEVADRGGEIGEHILDRCGPVDRCLPTTMCYHTFDQLTGRTLDDRQVFTSRGGSFRYEARYQRTMERLGDFTIRETVFLGPADFVRDARDRLRERAIELIEQLGLTGRCEVANDPFFAGTDGALRVSSQRLLELKHELHLEIEPDGHTMAVASFNLHEQHFGEAFEITAADGQPVYSACAGFGLERLTYALLCQYGWHVDDWPDVLRERCGTSLLTSTRGYS